MMYEHMSVTCVYGYMSVTVYKPVQAHTDERRSHWIWGYIDSQGVSPVILLSVFHTHQKVII